MPDPWLDPGIFAALCGGIGGGLLGALVGTAGGVGGTLARRGLRPAGVSAVLAAILLGGVVMLVVGIYALAVGQPSGIWASLMGMGALWGIVSLGANRAVRQLHKEAPTGTLAKPGPAPDIGRT